MKRRQFIKKAVESLGYVGMGLVAIFTGGKTGLPYIDSKDVPPMPKVKPPRLDDEEKISDILFSTIKNGKITFTALAQWHHFVYHRVGNVEKVYIDGEVDEIMTVFDISSSLANCEIKNYHRNQVGVIVEEEFWFKGKYIV